MLARCCAGESVYGEKRISVEGAVEGEKIEYRVWNPFRSKLAASVLAGVDNIHIRPGAKVPYLAAARSSRSSRSCPKPCGTLPRPLCIYKVREFVPL